MTEALTKAVNTIRTFYGLAIALRLLQQGYSYQAYPQKEKVYVHRKVDDTWTIEDVHELESRHSEVIRDLKLDDLSGRLDDEKQAYPD